MIELRRRDGGHVRGKSRDTKGSRFIVRLPLQDETSACYADYAALR